MLKNINIDFPFKNSPTGDFLNLNKTSAEAIKADIMHIILTNKGERYYLPDFGTNLRNYIFEQSDSISYEEIRNEVVTSLTKFIPNLKVNNILVEASEEEDYTAIVKLEYVITDDIFENKDSLIIKI
jgi:phage baseplate assembly protein W